MISGWLADKLQRRKLFVVLAGAICVPSIFLLGKVASLWQLALITGVLYFCLGMITAMATILAGLFAPEKERGKTFGILGAPTGLGGIPPLLLIRETHKRRAPGG